MAELSNGVNLEMMLYENVTIIWENTQRNAGRRGDSQPPLAHEIGHDSAISRGDIQLLAACTTFIAQN
jgi:hypothetical protein